MKHLKLVMMISIMIFSSMAITAQQGRGRLSTKKMKTKGERNQNMEERRSKILEKKLMFMKENLMLNNEEAKNFEKLYREYAQKKETLRKEYREIFGGKVKKAGVSEMSEKELNSILDQKMKIDNLKYKNKNEFAMNLRKILPPAKVIRYYKLERQFKKKLVQRLKKHQGKGIKTGRR